MNSKERKGENVSHFYVEAAFRTARHLSHKHAQIVQLLIRFF